MNPTPQLSESAANQKTTCRIRKSFTALSDFFRKTQQYVTSYFREVSIFPGGCYDQCFLEARQFSQGDHALVWEAKEFCRMGCEFRNVRVMSECTSNCYRSCFEKKGVQLGLSSILSETITKYDGHPAISEQCFQLCTKGCTFRRPRLPPPP